MGDTGKAKQLPKKTWAELLAETPPNVAALVTDLTREKAQHASPGLPTPSASRLVTLPDLELDCQHCDGRRRFVCARNEIPNQEAITVVVRGQPLPQQSLFLGYVCANCRGTEPSRVQFAVKLWDFRTDSSAGRALKLGQAPPYGPLTPARLQRMLQAHRDLFLKGRRAETEGLGIGAFTYYRRVVESSRSQLIEEILRVVQQGGNADAEGTLRAALEEKQFQKSLDMAKGAVPSEVFVAGHNPLALLHAALSEGVHNLSDEECLDRAHDIRIVLTRLAERIADVLKDQREVEEAAKRITDRKRAKGKAAGAREDGPEAKGDA